MKLLFIQGGSRVRECNNGNYYVDGNFNNDIWKRYNSYCDELMVILRKIDYKFNEKDIMNKYNIIDTNLMKLITVEDIYKPKKNFLNLKLKNKIKQTIKLAVMNSDKVVIRSIGNFYTNTALRYCKKFKKDYLIEVTGFAFEGLWHHSIFGKFVAIPREIKLKRALKKAPYAVYVTDEALQKRYPCSGKTLGCSDVELMNFDNSILENKLKRLENTNNVIKLGTAAFLDVKWKGQQDVINAIYHLNKRGYCKFQYELIGAGSSMYLEKLIKKYQLQNYIKILGVKTHEEVFEWLKDIDIYIQPSYQEGLCRAIVEAMSYACPVIASNAGGNIELINHSMIFPKGNIKKIEEILLNINENIMIENSKINFFKSQEYEREKLNNKRNEFYIKFIED